MSDLRPVSVPSACLSPGDIPAEISTNGALCKSAGQATSDTLGAFVASGDKTTGDIRPATNNATESDDRGRPGILTSVLNVAFGLGLTDAASARDWLRAGGWQQLDEWIAEHRGDNDSDPSPYEETGKAGRTTTP